MRNVPELRFAGFDGEWEENYLSEIAKINPKSTPLPEKFKYVDLTSVSGTSLIKFDIINKEEAPSRAQRVAKKGDIFYQTVRPYQKNNFFFDLEDTDFIFSTGYAQIRTNNNSRYLFTFMQTKRFVDTVMNRTTGTSFPAISTGELSDISIKIPSNISEQEKIGNLFRKMDALIEIQEGKVSKMEDFKKSMLQKMFPKKGELVPEFRFDGFDGEWESTKLSYISNRVTRRNLENQSKLPLTISSEFGLVNQLDYYNNRVASKDISNYYLIINGEFAYNKSTSLGAPYGAIKRLDNYENGALSTLYIVFKIVENNLDFIKYYFETSLWHKEIYKVSQEGARNHGLLNIATNDFFSMRIKLPPLAEQEKIGQFFKNLDAQIETEEKLLDSYKMIKKSLLQKMFV